MARSCSSLALVHSGRVATASLHKAWYVADPGQQSSGADETQVHELGLADDTIFTHKTAPAATNRFIYYPDHLVRLPGPGTSLLSGARSMFTEPIFHGVLTNALSETITRRRGQSSKGLVDGQAMDVSIGDFFAESCGKDFVERTLSAMIHGIYAGDPWKLSMRSIFPTLWKLTRGHDSLLTALLASMRGNSPQNKQELAFNEQRKLDPIPVDLRERFSSSTVFTFRRGLAQLPETLRQYLQDRAPNVHFQHSTQVIGMSPDQDSVSLHHINTTSQRTSEGSPTNGVTMTRHSEVVSTTRAAGLLKDSGPGDAPLITDQSWMNAIDVKSATVMTVNMYYREPDLHPPGFGYLIPRATPFEANPEMALGVIFDNCYSSAPGDQGGVPTQDTVSARGTKVTVMLGGHYWDGLSTFPDEVEGLRMARSLLRRHLGIRQREVESQVALATSCIPQYEIGHYDKLLWLHEYLVNKRADGKIHLAGSWINGVGVNDCLRSAWDVAENFGQSKYTGLNLAVFGPQRASPD